MVVDKYYTLLSHACNILFLLFKNRKHRNCWYSLSNMLTTISTLLCRLFIKINIHRAATYNIYPMPIFIQVIYPELRNCWHSSVGRTFGPIIAGLSTLYATICLPTMFACWHTFLQVDAHNLGQLYRSKIAYFAIFNQKPISRICQHSHEKQARYALSIHGGFLIETVLFTTTAVHWVIWFSSIWTSK